MALEVSGRLPKRRTKNKEHYNPYYIENRFSKDMQHERKKELMSEIETAKKKIQDVSGKQLTEIIDQIISALGTEKENLRGYSAILWKSAAELAKGK